MKIEKTPKYHRTPLVKTHRNICIMTPKAKFEILTLGQAKWPDLMNHPGMYMGVAIIEIGEECSSPTFKIGEEFLANLGHW